MKKFLLLMAIVLPFVLTSCGDDDKDGLSNSESQLIGEWVHNNSGYNYASHYKFKSDHSGSYWSTYNGEIDKDGVDYFKWSVKGDELIINRDGSINKMKFSISNGILHVNDGGEYGLDYEKVK